MGYIDKCKLEQIKTAATGLNDLLDYAENANIPPANKLEFLRNNHNLTDTLLKKICEVSESVNLEALQREEREQFIYTLSWAKCACDRFIKAVEDTTLFVKQSGYDVPPITNLCQPQQKNKAGRNKAVLNNQLTDYLKNCNPDEVIAALKSDPTKRKTSTYYGCVLLALHELGFIDFTDTDRKSIVFALDNTLNCCCNADNIQKLLKYGCENEEREKHRKTIDAIIETITTYSA